MTHLQVVEEVRALYPTPLFPEYSADFLVALCRRLHQEFPDEPAGLRRKDAGTHCTLPDGTNVALDIVMYPGGAAYDALADAEGTARPVWNKIADLPTDWYVEVNNGPTPPEPPVPPSDPCAELTAQVAALIAQQAALQQQVTQLEQVALRDGDTVHIGTVHGRNVRATPAPTWVLDQDEPPSGPWEELTLKRIKG